MGSDKQEAIQIGELSNLIGLSSRTIRLYEEMGLVPLPQRNTGGQRYYDQHHIKAFQFIQKLKVLGLSLDEMKEVVTVYDKELHIRKAKAPGLIDSITRKLSALRALHEDIVSFL